MVAQTNTTTQAAPVVLTVVPDFVTVAYSFGFEDGAQGAARQGFLYWTLTDPRQAEYRAGYAAGCLTSGRPNRYQAYPVDFGAGVLQ